MPTALFVYGSLMRCGMRGGENHIELVRAGARFVTQARTAPRYTLVALGEYPALLDGGITSVPGEIYTLEPAALAAIDEFEDVPRLYRRQPIEITGFDAGPVWAYFAAPDRQAAIRPISR